MTPTPTRSAALTDSGVLRLNTALRPEARYKALVDILPDVLIVTFDKSLRMLAMEGGAVNRLPMPASTVIGRRLDEFLSPARVPEVEPHLRAALRGEPTEFEFEASNGVIWWIRTVPLIDDRGQVSGGLAQWRDISDQRATERVLAEHARELERSNAELEQYAYVASHDLSEPLRMINAYLRLLLRRHGDELNVDAQQFVEFALGGAVRMRELIDDLLAFSQVGRNAADAGAVDLQALVEGTWRTLTVGRDVPAPTLLATGLPVVIGDAGQLGQVFQNLLSNALKFVEPGRSPVVEVTSKPLPDGGWALAVEDEGIGFDPERAERLFRMFQRLHTRDEYPGTGVGLAIARKVIEAHQGRIWAECRPGGGARFRIDLPAAPGAPEMTHPEEGMGGRSRSPQAGPEVVAS